tara:strand:- start:61 stop:453 length:393 start_codon:yes stop_codon:yes gene_type:complete
MNLENIFKNIIKIQFLFIVAILITIGIEDGVGGVDVELFVALLMEDTLFLLLVTYLVVYVVNFYFLYKFKPIGKTLYLPLIILGFILGTSISSEQYTSVDLLFEWVDGLLSGLVIALLYFTDIKDKFKET